MSKIAFITDLHWGVKNSSEYFLGEYENYFDTQFFPYLIQHNIKTVFICGDFWENRKTINILSFSKGLQFLQKFQSLGIAVYIIIGNHDVFYKNTNDFNSIEWMRHIEGVTVCDNTLTVEIEGFKVGMVNWINSSNKDVIEAYIKTEPYDILLGHFEIQSFEMTRGCACQDGYSTDFFDSKREIFSGHFHIFEQKGHITYIGNPFQTRWDELNEKKGFIVYDIGTRTWERVINTTDIYFEIIYCEGMEFQETWRNKYLRVWSTTEQFYDPNFLGFYDMLKENCYLVQHQLSDEQEETVVKSQVKLVNVLDLFKTNILQYPETQQNELYNVISAVYDRALLNGENI